MLLVLDVGNTNIVMGVYKANTLMKTWRIHTNSNTTEDEFGVLVHAMLTQAGIDVKDIHKAVISSVVPPMMNILDSFCRKYTGVAPHWVNAKSIPGMPIRYINPREVGADRIVNALSAFEKYRSALIVIDLGTATTFDAVSGEGEYLGGAIAPGINICADALYQKASKLPRVDLFAPPELVIGTDTITSIKSGIIFGYAGLVDGMVARMKKEMGTQPRVIATGGLAPLMDKVCDSIEIIEPNLTLEGLRLIGERI